ncbi:MAG: hypothetical protein LBF75_06215 [Treponema sp.]|jgi:hypothetical protein|nr:hypothetical protein [Treponema sp.]
MEVSFTLSLKEVLAKIPFDSPVEGPIDLDFANIAAPYYIRNDFRVSILYEDSISYEAGCVIYSPKHIVTVVIILKKQYEDALRLWYNDNTKPIECCCRRRELYCHETCHLVAIIRAFPSDRSSKVREDFIAKIKEKFTKSVDSAEKQQMVSLEKTGISPSIFDKDHFRYGNDSLNYFRLYQELMLNHDKMHKAVKKLCEKIAGTGKPITFGDMAQETLVSGSFFNIFPEKKIALQELLLEEMFK